MSKVQVDTIDTRSGTATMTIGSTNTTTVSIPKAVTLGASGTTVTIPSGATITNSGTATGFGFSAKNFFSAYAPSNNVANDTDTKIIYQTESFDDASAYDTSNGRFTGPSGESGKYFLYAKIRHYNNTSMNREVIYFYKNGGVYARFENKGDNVHNSVQISKVANLSAGDYIEVYYYQNSGSSNNIAQFSSDTDQEFTGYRIV